MIEKGAFIYPSGETHTVHCLEGRERKIKKKKKRSNCDGGWGTKRIPRAPVICSFLSSSRRSFFFDLERLLLFPHSEQSALLTH